MELVLAGGETVAVGISWPALVAAALVVAIIALVVVAFIALIDWISSRPAQPPRRPVSKQCNLRPEGSTGGDCEFACYIVYDDGTMDYEGEFTFSLSKLSQILGKELADCPKQIFTPL